jgi:hypothetical protein
LLGLLFTNHGVYAGLSVATVRCPALCSEAAFAVVQVAAVLAVWATAAVATPETVARDATRAELAAMRCNLRMMVSQSSRGEPLLGCIGLLALPEQGFSRGRRLAH